MEVEYLQKDIVGEGIDGDSCEGFKMVCIVKLHNRPEGICGSLLALLTGGPMLFDTQPF